jgi:hypothetical protein
MATKRKPKEAPRLFGPPLERPSIYKGGISAEEIEHMRNCEAREWIRRYKDKAKTIGLKQASDWWQEHLVVMQKIRGESAILDLRRRMTEQQKKAKNAN